MVAVGITSKGYRKEFNCSNGLLSCCDKDLVSLEIPNGVISLYCRNNKLTELIIPEYVTHIFCNNKKLSELKLPESVIWLRCDKEVSDLDRLIGEIYIELW